jgi:hypothetical protein
MKMKKLRAVINCGILVMLYSMIAMAQSVQTDYDRLFNLARLKTYGFLELPRKPGDPLAESPLNDRRIHNALDSDLQANGFSPSGQPDFLIAYYVTTKQGFDIQENRYGIGPWGWDRWSNINVKQVTEGTLVLMFIDPATRQEVWRGMASGTIKQKSMDKEVNKSAAKLVERFVKDRAGKK